MHAQSPPNVFTRLANAGENLRVSALQSDEDQLSAHRVRKAYSLDQNSGSKSEPPAALHQYSRCEWDDRAPGSRARLHAKTECDLYLMHGILHRPTRPP